MLHSSARDNIYKNDLTTPETFDFPGLFIYAQITNHVRMQRLPEKVINLYIIVWIKLLKGYNIMISEIYSRRSIRKFLPTPIPKQDMNEIIQSGIKAPSSKNRQPWKYFVIQGNAKEKMLDIFRQGIKREESQNSLLPKSKQHIVSAKHTVDIMAEAPVIVFVVNSLGKSLFSELTLEEHISEICNIQSISASIQNMLLTATEKGIGSLWICDIYFAYPELCTWLNCDGQLIAALAFGYPNETPGERPRKKIGEVVEWRI